MKSLTTLALLAILAAACSRQSTSDYRLTVDDTLALMLSTDDLVNPETAQKVIREKRPGYRLVDVRSPAAYNESHLGDAVNIPTQYLLDPENLASFADESIVHILYGSDQLEANGPWLLLRQLGYANVKIMEGGYGYFAATADTTAPEYRAETPRFDFAAVFRAAAERERKALEAPVVAPPPAPKRITPKPKPKVVEEEEGC